MLISRIAMRAYAHSDQTPTLTHPPPPSSVNSSNPAVINDRKGSLNYMWTTFQKNLQLALEKQDFLERIYCDVIDKTEKHWIPAFTSINADGLMELKSVNNDHVLMTVMLHQCTVIGHLDQDLVQLFTKDTTLLLKCRRPDFPRACASFLAHSKLRPSGIERKMWHPTAGAALYSKPLLLSSNVKAQFTSNTPLTTQSWTEFGASLTGSGELRLVNQTNQVVYSLQITKVLSSHIILVDHSLVGSNLVLLLFPDLGGPDTVYIRFNDRYECEEWMATLRALSMQPVAVPIGHNPSESVRFVFDLVIKIGQGELKQTSLNPPPANKNIDKSWKYVEIYTNKWLMARTSMDSGPQCLWNQQFEFKNASKDLQPPRTIELKLKQSIAGVQQHESDLTLGSVLVNFEDSGKWHSFDFKPSRFKIDVCVERQKLPVLDVAYYQRLNDWVSNLQLNVPSILVDFHKPSINKLFPIFDMAYRAQGRQLEWIFHLISKESQHFKNNTDTLFRESTLLTRAIEALLHQQGKSILVSTVGRFVRKLFEVTNDALELDPSKVLDEDVLNRNRDSMLKFLTLLWSFIRYERLPPLCKPIFKQFKLEFEKAGMEKEELQNALYRTMASFLFLRFYVPALINPQNWNLTDHVLNAGQRRTLLLVAKILQAFANRVKFGKKEQWLQPMNLFIENDDASLVRWYDSILNDENNNNDKEDVERPPKQVPVNTFMGMQLSSPSLIDEPAVYSQLANYLANDFERTLDVDAQMKLESDKLVQNMIQESKRIVQRQNRIISNLSEPDSISNCDEEFVPQLHLNSETLLFGTNPEQLEPPAPSEHPTQAAEVQSTRGAEKKTSSVKKLTQMLKLNTRTK